MQTCSLRLPHSLNFQINRKYWPLICEIYSRLFNSGQKYVNRSKVNLYVPIQAKVLTFKSYKRVYAIGREMSILSCHSSFKSSVFLYDKTLKAKRNNNKLDCINIWWRYGSLREFFLTGLSSPSNLSFLRCNNCLVYTKENVTVGQ